MLPSKTQVDAFHSCGYVEATASFKRLHGRFQGLCGIGARPLIIIWPAGGRQRNVTVELFRCTDSILDERFQSGMKTLAQTWGALAINRQNCRFRSLAYHPEMHGYWQGIFAKWQSRLIKGGPNGLSPSWSSKERRPMENQSILAEAEVLVSGLSAQRVA